MPASLSGGVNRRAVYRSSLEKKDLLQKRSICPCSVSARAGRRGLKRALPRKGPRGKKNNYDSKRKIPPTEDGGPKGKNSGERQP